VLFTLVLKLLILWKVQKWGHSLTQLSECKEASLVSETPLNKCYSLLFDWCLQYIKLTKSWSQS
jgi:hypothetical protein